MEQDNTLDPVSAIQAYSNYRSSLFGQAEESPFFLHQDGRLYTKNELNLDLKALLSLYPVLAQSDQDSWTGHSFRQARDFFLLKIPILKKLYILYRFFTRFL